MLSDNETECLLYLLWSKASEGGLPFVVSDTIICKDGKVKSWYFTAKDGLLKRKTKRNLILERVRECLSKKSKNGIVGSIYTFNEYKDSIIISFDHVFYENLGKS